MALDILDPVLGPVLTLPPIIGIFLVALMITVIILTVYKFTTDQKKMKQLKEELKEFQTKIKKISKEDPQKALKIQQEAMSKNMEYAKHSFKSTLYTFLPIMLIFFWLNTHMAYLPIVPDQEFKVTAFFSEGHADQISLSTLPDLEIIGEPLQNITFVEGKEDFASWKLKGAAGDYKLIFNYNNEKYEQPLLITSEREYQEPIKLYKDSKLKKTVIGNEKIKPFGSFKIFGYEPGWIITYIFFSLVLNILFRKLFKIY
jgi:uncharacterized membrane protein (DUF106 family)